MSGVEIGLKRNVGGRDRIEEECREYSKKEEGNSLFSP